MISKAEIEKVRELAKAATPGPWEIRSTRTAAGYYFDIWCSDGIIVEDGRQKDTAYIAEMHPQRTLAWADEIERQHRAMEDLAAMRVIAADAEAKLAKAIEALQFYARDGGDCAPAILAELKK